jgi:PKHD-type hydroxylase
MRYEWWFSKQKFNAEQCDNLIKFCEQFPEEKATIFADKEVHEEIRRSTVRWVPKDTFVETELLKLFSEANRYFNVEIRDLFDIQFTEYHASISGHYDWHHDVNFSEVRPYDRKLSIVIQLSEPDDYEGGEFEFNSNEKIEGLTERGSVLVFPSYRMHRVTPVTSGIRKSLVSWIEGPRWR